jgi:hypothetical protein
MKAAERVALYRREIAEIEVSRDKPNSRPYLNRLILANAAIGELQGAIAEVERDPLGWEQRNPGAVT